MAKPTRLKITGILIALAISLLSTFIACDFQPTVIFDSAKSGDITLPFLTKAEIRQLLEETDSKHLPSPVMEEEPDYNPMDSSSPWNPGKVKQEALDLALARINVIRRLCGLPPMITQEAGNNSAQYGAALMAITQVPGHGTQPEWPGIDSASIKKGKDATGAGNIYELPPEQIVSAMDGYCRDQGNPGVGHRLTLLAPSATQIGIGTAPPPPTGGRGANVVQVYSLPALPQDYIHKEFDWDFISYPSSGYFPLRGSLFGNPASWSIKLNTKHYAKIGDKANEVPAKDVAVSLIRTSDGATWNFCIDDDTEILTIGDLLVYNCEPGHFIPGGDTIIFRILKENPEHPGDPNKRIDYPYKDGEIYQVQVHGLKDKSGNPVDFAFQTEFFTP